MNEPETILIIENKAQMRHLLKTILSVNGYKIIQAIDGKEGLVNAATLHPSLVLLGLGLPDIDGQEVLKRLRKWFGKPVIVLSERSSEDEIIRALDNGANDYLTKPFSPGELLARIRAALRISERFSAN